MELHWLEQFAADVPSDDDWLSASEQQRFAQMRIPKRRKDWRLGRWTAKLALAGYFGLSPVPELLRYIEIRPHSSGAPEAFRNGLPAEASISLSHRDGVAICAIAPSGTEIGCDLELVETRSAAFVSDYFTEEEQDRIAHSPASERDLVVTVLWSAKESALKALRTGLRVDTRSVSVALPPLLVRPAAEMSGFDWSPLSVSCVNDKCFSGWWACVDGLVRALVSLPSAGSPSVEALRTAAKTLPSL